MKTEINRLVKKYIDLAGEVYGREFSLPTMDWKQRPSMTAGKAWPTLWKLWINIPVHQAKPEMLEDTVAHEVAHLIAWKELNYRGHHGLPWKRVMVALGQTPDRTYRSTDEQKLAGKNTRRHVYVCECGAEINISTKRHNSMLRGITVFHKGCRGKRLTFIRSTDKHTLAREAIARSNAGDAAATPKPPKQVPTYKAKAASKLNLCRELYELYSHLGRAATIKHFVANGCTPAGASTYYSKIKKENAGA